MHAVQNPHPTNVNFSHLQGPGYLKSPTRSVGLSFQIIACCMATQPQATTAR